MTIPVDHFFIVGAQRCGTTYLCSLLDEHPAIEMARPFRPEPKYFLRNPPPENATEVYEATYFGSKPGARVRGEKSTSYMESRAAAAGIAQAFPEARIVFVIRNPVERAISHYWFSVSNGLETMPIADAFLREAERSQDFDPASVSVSPFAYLSRGRYIDAMNMYAEFFPRDRIATVFYEEMTANVGAVQRLFQFLGVDDRYSPTGAGRRVNEGRYESNGLTADLATYVDAYFQEPSARLAEFVGRDPRPLWKFAADMAPAPRPTT